MFDIGWDEMLLTAIVAIVVIGPKDLPRALRTAGRWIGKIRRISGHFRSGVESMIREAELEDMEKKWREQNEAVMREHPPVVDPVGDNPGLPMLPAPPVLAQPPSDEPLGPEIADTAAEPELPLGKR